MLYDGAIRFGSSAVALEARNFEQSYTMISRCRDHHRDELEHEARMAPGAVREDGGVVTTTFYRKLVEANIEHEVASLDEALRILRYQRETWQLLIGAVGKTKAAAAADKLDMPAAGRADGKYIRVSA